MQNGTTLGAPVTDPNLIAQLEGSGGAPASSYGSPVTDPALISQLEGAGQQAQDDSSFLPHNVGANVLAGLAKLGHGLLNTPHNVVSSFDPQMGAKIPAQQDYNFSSMLGINNPNLADKLIQGTVQYAPYMLGGEAALATMGGKSAPLLTRLLAQSGAGATFGATQSQNPMTGAAIGAGFGAGAELAPAAIGSIKNFLSAKPQKYAESLLNNLGGGNTLEDNAKSLAQDISNSHNAQVADVKNQYGDLFNKFGNNQIYKRLDPIYGNSQKGSYENLNNNYSGDLQDLHNKFISNPTLQNAHNLQSQLGADIGSMNYANSKGILDPQGKNTLSAYQKARGSLLNDVHSYLGSQGLDPLSTYRSATNRWSTNVVPYLSDPNLAQIAKGEITNPTYSQIYNIFKNPESEIQKVVGDIGAQANNKILYNELGKNQANLTPESLSGVFSKLDDKGLASYVSPALMKQMQQLSTNMLAKKVVQSAGGLAAGTLAGTLAGAHFGIPYAGEIGAGIGALSAPLAARFSQSIPSIPFGSQREALANALMSAGKAAYRPTVNTGTANLINWQGGQ